MDPEDPEDLGVSGPPKEITAGIPAADSMNIKHCTILECHPKRTEWKINL